MIQFKSSISREAGYSKNEASIYHESIQIKKEDFNSAQTPLENISKLQHYGVPTRLIDVTIDPLIALYFAISNIEDESPGVVYIYLANGLEFEDEHTKVLSILPTLETLTLESVKKECKKVFDLDLSDNQILSYVSKPIFIRHCDKLKTSNDRLYCQSGAFFICGNEIENDNIFTRFDYFRFGKI